MIHETPIERKTVRNILFVVWMVALVNSVWTTFNYIRIVRDPQLVNGVIQQQFIALDALTSLACGIGIAACLTMILNLFRWEVIELPATVKPKSFTPDRPIE